MSGANCCELRRIRFSRWGMAENPVGQIVVDDSGQLYEVVETYRRESPSAIMLRVRYFNRETAPDIAAGAVKIVPSHYHEVSA